MAGIDKKGRLEAKRAEEEAARQARVRSLNPKFPWRVVPFDAAFFGLPQEPRPHVSGSTRVEP